MKPILLNILIILTLYSCTHQQSDRFQDKMQSDTSVTYTAVQDSIDKYGYSGCDKPAPSELYQSIPKVMDSLWTVLLTNNQKDKTTNKYSKAKFKEALIKDNFVIDSSDKDFTATKKAFNQRLRATWKKDSDTVELYLTRWYKGYTYDLFSSSDKFDK
jgi:hypothetical protein